MRNKFLFLILLILIGCGKGSAPTTLSDIQGHWVAKCVPMDNGAGFTSGTFDINGNSLEATLQFFTDAACTGVASPPVSNKGTFVLGNDLSDGKKEIDITANGTVTYSIIKVSGNKLQGGKSSGANDGSTPATRHTELSIIVFSK